MIIKSEFQMFHFATMCDQYLIPSTTRGGFKLNSIYIY